jgi:hypothetical protein
MLLLQFDRVTMWHWSYVAAVPLFYMHRRINIHKNRHLWISSRKLLWLCTSFIKFCLFIGRSKWFSVSWEKGNFTYSHLHTQLCHIKFISSYLQTYFADVITYYVPKSSVFWAVRPCAPLKVSQRYEAIRLCLLTASYWFTYSSTQKTEVTCSSETSVDVKQTTSQKIELFITTAVKFSNSTNDILFKYNKNKRRSLCFLLGQFN